MSDQERRCRICGHVLSQHNKWDVCFCHDEHPEKKYMPERDHSPGPGPGHATPGLNETIMNEYGPYGFR